MSTSKSKIAVYGKQAIEERDYWIAKLSSETQASNLMLDYERPDCYFDEKDAVALKLPDNLTEMLDAVTGNSPFLLYTALLSTVKICLHKYTGSNSIAVGSPARKKSEVLAERANALTIIDELNGQMTFRDFLSSVRETLLRAYSRQNYPFERLIKDLALDHIDNRCPLFAIAVAFEEIHTSLPDVKNDITITFAREDGSISARAEFNQHLFMRESIEIFMNHFIHILSQGLQNTGALIADLSMITEAERLRMLVEWNDTRTDVTENAAAHRLFEMQVERAPEAVAVVFEGRKISYKDLNSHANRLARHLQSLGVGPEVLVGVYLNRSIEMVVTLLAILKAGGAYVPMNPRHPRDRISFILNHTGALAVLTDSELAETLPESEAAIVCLDSDWEAIALHSGENLDTEVSSSSLAYAIYTSGSTGEPKGVMVCHRGLCNLAAAQIRGFDVKPDSRMLQFAALSFDASASEIFVTLLAGAALCLARQESLLPGPAFMRLMRENGITTVTFPPSVLSAIQKEELPDLRTIVVAGEACPARLVSAWAEAVRFINAYGPTEATVCATMAECIEEKRKPPIGRPIANTRTYLLNSNLEPVPIGVPGELHIGGMGVARGYLNRPDLTAEKFIPDPFGDEPGARLYKTGDLARYVSDGNIEFLGRVDYQIKLRGFRIEPGEIEENLRQHKPVQDAAVLAREDTPGNKRLVAYVVLSTGAEQEEPADEGHAVADLRAYLQEKLPEYMMPSAFVILDELPLTPSGKVDRQALPEPKRTRSDLASAYIAPRTNTEALLAGIWAQVLGAERVGIHDNFFEMGGHSLLVPEVMFGVQKAFKMELPLRVIFEAPVLSELADAIDLASRDGIAALETLTFDEMEAEAVLDPSISPDSMTFEFITDPASILLTGSTGFVGVFLLSELLKQTEANIYCLVRADESEQAKERIEKQLKEYLVWEDSMRSRIIPVVGDLSKSLFGLSEEEFESLAKEIDIIYHGGAAVNFFDPFYKLKAANVGGTQEILRLATQIKVKPVHYISTMSVFSATADGYSGTKWVAEKLVTIARERGLPVVIYRPGFVTGDAEKGIWNLGDMMSRIIKGCIQLHKAPELGVMVDMTPVDYLCKALVYLSKQEESLGKAFHLVNPRRLDVTKIIEYINNLGYPLEEVHYNEWAAELFESCERSRDNALYPMLPLFPENVPDDPNINHEVHIHDPRYFQEEMIKRDRQITDEALAKSPFVCPSVAELLDTYFSYFRSSGYLEPPSATR